MAIADYPTIAAAAEGFRSRRLSPVELTDACLDRIHRLDDRVSAFITVLDESARNQARAAEQEIMHDGPRGDLHGIPVVLKDVFDVEGVLTSAQSRHLEHNVATAHSSAAERLLEAGAILIGKTGTHEFALSGPSFDLPWPPTRNPWNVDHFAAGSSSGTAASVASGMALGGVGSDSGGSIRSPAAYCGVTGLKPTYGRVSRHGLIPTSFSLDHVGPMAWTAQDCAILLQCLAGFDRRDPSTSRRAVPDFVRDIGAGAQGIRVGIARHLFETELSVAPSTLLAMNEVIEVLESLGAGCSNVNLTPLADWKAVGSLIMYAEAYAIHEDRLRDHPERYGELVRDYLRAGASITATDYIRSLQRRRILSHELKDQMKDIDILLLPTQPGEAPRIDAVSKWRGFTALSATMPFNVSGYPAISLCCGFGPAGLPLAVQLVAKPFHEELLLRVAHSYQRATAWTATRPTLI